MIFEIINFHDPVTIVSDDFKAACCACLYLSTSFGLKGVDNDKSMPVFLLGGGEEWFKETFEKDFYSCLQDVGVEKLAEVLDTVVAGTPSDRVVFDAAMRHIKDPEGQEKFKDEWNEKKTSSLKGIPLAARRSAAFLRENKKD
jgi:hypothetical protein